jgi:lipid-binding SYLF domain-containing protein
MLEGIAMKAAKLCLAVMFSAAGAGVVTMPGCASSPDTRAQISDLALQGKTDIRVIEHDDPSITNLVNNSYGYAIFPDIGKGGVGIEGGGGYGDVFEQGKYYGTSELTMGGVGITAGGETYTELLVFRTKEAFSNFTNSGLKFDAAASAVAIRANATATPIFVNDVAVFKYNTKGLMFDASVGGQQFTVKPAKTMTTTAPAM